MLYHISELFWDAEEKEDKRLKLTWLLVDDLPQTVFYFQRMM